MRPIDADELYNKTRDLEERAMAIINSMSVSNEKDIKKFDYWNAILNERTAFKHDIADAPTITEPERKKGRWIKMSDADGVYWSCSECGEDIPRVSDFDPQFDLFPKLKSIDPMAFCPHCGADMRSEQDEQI